MIELSAWALSGAFDPALNKPVPEAGKLADGFVATNLGRRMTVSALLEFAVWVKSTGPSKSAPAAAPKPSVGRQAEVTKRLAALIGPYKEAVSQNGPAAAQMRSRMDAAKKHIVQRDFEEAAKDLDELEPLVEQSKAVAPKGLAGDGPAQPLEGLVRPAFASAAAGAPGGISGGPQTAPQRILKSLQIRSNGHSLVLAPGGRMQLFPIATYTDGSSEAIPPNLVDWMVDPDDETIKVDEKGTASGRYPGVAHVKAKDKHFGKVSPPITFTVREIQPAGDSPGFSKLPRELLQVYGRAKEAHEFLLESVRELDRSRKVLPPTSEILKEIDNNTTEPLSNRADRGLIHKEVQEQVAARMGDLKAAAEASDKQIKPLMKKILAEKLLQDAAELRKKAEEMEKARERFMKFLEDGLKIAKAVAVPELKVIDALEMIGTAIRVENDLAKEFNAGVYGTIEELREKANQEEKQAHDMRLDALKEEVKLHEEARKRAEAEMEPALESLLKIANEIDDRSKKIEAGYDASPKARKGKFQFSFLRSLMDVARRIVNTLVPAGRKSAGDAYKAISKFERSQHANVHQLNDDVLAWAEEAKVIGEQTADILDDLADLQEEAHEAMAHKYN
jgi:hypothetical protein